MYGALTMNIRQTLCLHVFHQCIVCIGLVIFVMRFRVLHSEIIHFICSWDFVLENVLRDMV